LCACEFPFFLSFLFSSAKKKNIDGVIGYVIMTSCDWNITKTAASASLSGEGVKGKKEMFVWLLTSVGESFSRTLSGALVFGQEGVGLAWKKGAERGEKNGEGGRWLGKGLVVRVQQCQHEKRSVNLAFLGCVLGQGFLDAQLFLRTELWYGWLCRRWNRRYIEITRSTRRGMATMARVLSVCLPFASLAQRAFVPKTFFGRLFPPFVSLSLCIG
jgi:hypothetical protein